MSILGDNPILGGTADGLQDDVIAGAIRGGPGISVPDLLWLQTQNDGIRQYDYEGNQLFSHSTGSGFDLAVDPDGTYYGRWSGGIGRKFTADGSGSVIWTFDLDSNISMVCALSPDGHIYAGNTSDGSLLHKINAKTGNKIWEHDCGFNNPRGVAVDQDGFIYVLLRGEGIIKVSPDNDRVWDSTGFFGAGKISVSPDGHAYGGSTANDGTIYKLSQDGQSIIWGYTGHTSEPTVMRADNQGHVYSGSFDDTIAKIDDDDGSEIWRVNLGSNVNEIALDPHGNVFAGTRGNDLFRLDPSNGDTIWEVDTGGTARGLLTAHLRYGAFPERW